MGDASMLETNVKKPRLAGKKVIIFGGMGFLGINLAKKASEEGAEITIVDRNTPPDVDKRLEYINNRVKSIKADVREASTVRSLLEDKDVVYYFAGLSGAVNTNQQPFLSLSVGCEGHLRVLESAREMGSKGAIVFPSSWLVYGRIADRYPVSENHRTMPLSIYGVHKLACEYHSTLYSYLYGLNTVAFRISNPFGPFQSQGNRHYGIINNFINSALCDQDLVIFGDGRQLRDYIHVESLVELLMLAGLREDNNGEIYNVGSGVSTRLIDVAQSVVRICGGGRIRHVDWPEEYWKVEAGDYRADISKVCDRYGWRPSTDLEDGLNRTVSIIRKQ